MKTSPGLTLSLWVPWGALQGGAGGEGWGGHPVALQGHAGCPEGTDGMWGVLRGSPDPGELAVCGTSTVGREEVWRRHGVSQLRLVCAQHNVCVGVCEVCVPAHGSMCKVCVK